MPVFHNCPHPDYDVFVIICKIILLKMEESFKQEAVNLKNGNIGIKEVTGKTSKGKTTGEAEKPVPVDFSGLVGNIR